MSSEMIFWSGAVAMVAVALLFLLPALLGRGKGAGIARRETNLVIFQQRLEELKEDLSGGEISDQQFTQAEDDLKRELLADLEGEDEEAVTDSSAGRLGAVVVLILIPLIAFGLYGQIGSPEATTAEAVSARGQQEQGGQKEAFEQAVAQLERKLEQNPDNVEGWMMLAKSYGYLGQQSKITATYERAIRYLDDRVDPQLLMEYGEALAAENGGSWLGEPMGQLKRALEIDPQHSDALWISGHVYFDLGRYEEALGFWKRLATTVPGDDAEVVKLINEAGFTAQEQLGLERAPLLELAAAATGTALTVSVRLAPALQDKASSDAVVFVYAKAIGKKGPPLAAQRLTVADLPATVRLDDSMSILPGSALSSHEQVIVGARVSSSGDASVNSGDLVGTIEASTRGGETIQLLIDRVNQ